MSLSVFFVFVKDNWFLMILLFFIKPLIKGISQGIENGLTNRPQFNHEKNLENSKIIAQKEIQVDSYYREISGSDMSDILEFWVGFLSNPKSAEKLTQEIYNEQMKMLIKVASGKSITIFSLMQQYNYSRKDGELDLHRYFMYISMLISQLKEDFTGQIINPKDLLKSKMKDYFDSEKKWDAAYKFVNTEIEKTS